ncbi:MAG: SEC-C metal-binding domain-containing protein, partial [Treponema sp.]|nr:SEC-C metal-binding domain-containing protein [Treponema sp.]
SIEKSEKVSALLSRRGVRHEVLNAKNHEREALIIAEAGAKGSVTIATNMAGRGTDIKLGGNPESRARRRAGTNASPEQYAAIYNEEYEKWKKDYEEVKSIGGLYVIGTERHESRRIDNQLRGRSGRQGDPGRSKFFISMDDELMRLFGGEKMKNIMSRIGMPAGEPINHSMLNKSIENAQKKVEERNFEIRKHLLEYDDVLNQQRKFIYEQRDAILLDKELKQRVNNATAAMVNDMIDDYNASSRNDVNIALNSLKDQLRAKFGYNLSVNAGSDIKNIDNVEKQVIADLEKDMDDKEALIGNDYLSLIIRDNYLHAIDRKWLDHLENMEALREAVYLRHYAQKNPLVEYKLEGFRIFDKMLDEIRHEIASRLHLIRIQINEDGPRRSVSRSAGTSVSASHSSMASFSGGNFGGNAQASSSSGSPMDRASRPQNATVVRAQPKVGRNDPCPCGSGKKYKHCHGS